MERQLRDLGANKWFALLCILTLGGRLCAWVLSVFLQGSMLSNMGSSERVPVSEDSAPWSPGAALLQLVTKSPQKDIFLKTRISKCISNRCQPGQEVTDMHTPRYSEGNLPAILSGTEELGRSHSLLSLLLFPLMLISSFISTWVGDLWVSSPFGQQGAFINIHGAHIALKSTADVHRLEISRCQITERVISLSFFPSAVTQPTCGKRHWTETRQTWN